MFNRRIFNKAKDPIEFIGAIGGATSATLPGHIAGDIIICFASIAGSIAYPTIPSGWELIVQDNTTEGADYAGLIAYTVATSPGTSSGTWTGASNSLFSVYRNVSSIGNSTLLATAMQNYVRYPALTLSVGDGSGWVLGFGATPTETVSAPTGMANRVNRNSRSNNISAIHDTNGGVTSWGQVDVTIPNSRITLGGTVELIN